MSAIFHSVSSAVQSLLPPRPLHHGEAVKRVLIEESVSLDKLTLVLVEPQLAVKTSSTQW